MGDSTDGQKDAPNSGFLPFADGTEDRVIQGTPNSGLLSFTADVIPLLDPYDGTPPETDPPAGTIWATLRDQIAKLVKKDGIRKDAIQAGETESDVLSDAVDTIYHDVAEFYAWYFTPNDPDAGGDEPPIVRDDRAAYLERQKQATILGPIRASVRAVVEDNLAAMRDADEIPEGQDTPGMDEVITDALSRYIFNWQDWYYDRKKEDDIDNYFEQKSIYEDIYIESDYGDLTNLLDGDQFDGVSDVPYIAED